MTARSTRRPVGAPGWIDISVTDPDRSKAFYREVLGWDYTGGQEEFGGYLNATVDGLAVAGMAPPMEGMPEPPHEWTVYLVVADAEAASRAVTDAGGTTLMSPVSVGPFGTMALHADPTGAGFGLWQPGSHQGFEAYDVPGAVAWTEAMVGDFDRGRRFYADVFGWTYEDLSEGDMRYAVARAPGEDRSGTAGLGLVGAGEGPYWSVVLQVADTDEAVARVRDAGGRVTTEPFDSEHGRIAEATGPDGERFALMRPPTA
ncbi:VOC family protein [Ornithinimicrobium sp. W1665]|uniref:VOC family protein n=1 Tax=Ornithinimicrobium sp. W1665 TaxID=3416666 RepID=UPI003CF529AC